MEKNIKFKPFIYWITIISLVSILISLTYINTEKLDKQYTSFCTDSGKQVEQYIYGPDSQKISECIKNEIINLENNLSSDVPFSDISRINNAKGKWVNVSLESIKYIEKSISMAKESNGKYDPTYLSNLYKGNERIPEYILSKEMKKVNFNYIEIDKSHNRVRINNEGTILSLNSIMDEILCEKAIEIYKNSRINKAMIQIGKCTGYFNYPDENNVTRDDVVKKV